MSALVIAMALFGASAPVQNADQLLRSYSECAARRSSEQMHAMLDAWDETAYRTAAEKFSGDMRCTSNDDVTTVVLTSAFSKDRGKLRGMVAESLLARSKTVTNLSPLPKASAYSAAWTTATGRVSAVDEMSICVAATDPGGIRALLATPQNSARQRQVLASLSPSLGNCLAKGYQLDASPASLRAALAEALYHRDRAGNGVRGS